jgi:alkylhydroperoxidase/carboxymuconolactone decarboxylase family protein YurZ
MSNLRINSQLENALKSQISEILAITIIVSCIAAKKFRYLESVLNYVKLKKSIKVTKIFECILQVYLFCGFPATIESLKIFHNIFITYSSSEDKRKFDEFIEKGQKICKLIYRNNYEKLMINFIKLSPDLKNWMIIEGYGKVMGRKGLTVNERELINVAVLCTNYYEHQLYSHIKGAINTGSDINDVKRIINSTQLFNTKTNVRKALKVLNLIESSNKS